jgi:hypothetical protein
MQWFISHDSALELWRRAPIEKEDILRNKKLRAGKLPESTGAPDEIPRENFWGLSAPLHVLAQNTGVRRTTATLRRHICSQPLPTGSLIQISPELIVASPELCFLQMASELSLLDLVGLGFEFCGTYRLDKQNEERTAATLLRGLVLAQGAHRRRV